MIAATAVFTLAGYRCIIVVASRGSTGPRAHCPRQEAAIFPYISTRPAPHPEEHLMRSLPDRICAERVQGWNATFHLRLDGDPPPEWTVRIAGGRCSVAKGLEGTPDCVVSTSAPILAGIESGAIDPKLAFLLGRIRASDLDSLLRLVRALRRSQG